MSSVNVISEINIVASEINKFIIVIADQASVIIKSSPAE